MGQKPSASKKESQDSMHRFNPYLRLLRPHQYVKNGFLFLPAFFGHKLTEVSVLLAATQAFVVFCLAASAVYAFNDIKDQEADRLHPRKRFRPLASGEITVRSAYFFAIFLSAAAIIGAFWTLPKPFLGYLTLYLVLNLAYSFGLKHLAIIDVVMVSLGFVIRIFAGAAAASIQPSQWLVLMTFLLALFLSLAKRRDDLLVAEEGQSPRKSLDGYNLEFVTAGMVFMAAVTVVSYILYTVAPENIIKHGERPLYLTSFWVIVGLLRYLQLTLVFGNSGAPTRILLQDRFLNTVVLGWILTFFALFYFPVH